MRYKLKLVGTSVALATAFAVGTGVGSVYVRPPTSHAATSHAPDTRLMNSFDMSAAIEELAATGTCSEPYRGEGEPPTNFCERAKRALAAERREGTR